MLRSKGCAAVLAMVLLVSCGNAFAASNKSHWATAGKVLTGVAAVSVLATVMGSGNRGHDGDRDRDDDRGRGHDRDRRSPYVHDRWRTYPPRTTVVYYQEPTVYRTVYVQQPVVTETRTVYVQQAPAQETRKVYWEE